MRRWTFSPIALACALSCSAAASVAATAGTQVIELPLVGPAYQIADMAYKALARGDTDSAIKYAREAIRLRPDVARLKTLLQEAQRAAVRKTQKKQSGSTSAPYLRQGTTGLHTVAAATLSMNAAAVGEPDAQRLSQQAYQLTTQNRLQEALRLSELALQLSDGNQQLQTQLQLQRNNIRNQLAQESATLTFQQLANNDTVAAEHSAAKAIVFAPEVMNYHLLHIQTLLQLKQYAAAEQAANRAIERLPEEAPPLVLRGYVRQLQNRYAEASTDYQQALNQAALSDANRRQLRLYIADANLAAGDDASAQTLLANLPDDDKEALWRRSLLALLQQQRAAKAPALLPPVLDFKTNADGSSRSLAASENAANALLPFIYQAQQNKQTDKAVVLARQLYALAPHKDSYRRALVQALAAAGRHDESRQLAAGLNNDNIDLGIAYIAMAAGSPEIALQTFEQADAAGKLPPRDLQNAAFAALNANERNSASAFFKRAIDAVANNSLPMTDQELLETRRAVSEAERQWGGYLSASYRGSNNMQTGQNQTATVGDNLQLGGEVYWRPQAYNRDGQYIDLYTQLTGTIYSAKTTSSTGFTDPLHVGMSTLMSSFGVRWKPLASQNLLLAVERRQAIGSVPQNDWLARIGYSYNKGTELRADSQRWTTHQLFAETGYYLKSKIKYFTSELQSGESFLLPERLLRNASVFPHVVIGADYNTGYQHAKAVGAGLGVNMRYWFREDRYHAPQSYFDLSLQYRRKIAGDDRASGWFLRSVFSY